jgi:hypothetical protein
VYRTLDGASNAGVSSTPGLLRRHLDLQILTDVLKDIRKRVTGIDSQKWQIKAIGKK